jgi:hypothetical protein
MNSTNVLSINNETEWTTSATYTVAQEAQQARWEAEMQMRQLMAQIEANRKPFDETEEFRDFMVWLCGFADRDEVPDRESWLKLRGKVEKVAAKFATRSLNPVLEPQQTFWPNTTGTVTYAAGTTCVSTSACY